MDPESSFSTLPAVTVCRGTRNYTQVHYVYKALKINTLGCGAPSPFPELRKVFMKEWGEPAHILISKAVTKGNLSAIHHAHCSMAWQNLKHNADFRKAATDWGDSTFYRGFTLVSKSFAGSSQLQTYFTQRGLCYLQGSDTNTQKDPGQPKEFLSLAASHKQQHGLRQGWTHTQWLDPALIEI